MSITITQDADTTIEVTNNNTLHVVSLVVGSTVSPAPAARYLSFTVTSEMLSTDGDGYQVLTNDAIDGRNAIAVLDGNQTYNGFTQNDNAITMTNGAVFVANVTKITLLFA